MQTVAEIVKNPSGWDSMANFAGSVPGDEWLSAITWTRDAGILDESNKAAATARLGGLSDNVRVFRFGHWACSWWECLAVRAGTQAATIGEEIARRIDGYPILDEDDFTRREDEEAARVWRECYDAQERAEYIRGNRGQFDFHDWADLRAVVRGDYFNGYAGELVA